MAKNKRYFWVIELGPPCGPMYFTGQWGPGGEKLAWSASIHEAVKAPTADAARAIRREWGISEPNTRVCEHAYIE